MVDSVRFSEQVLERVEIVEEECASHLDHVLDNTNVRQEDVVGWQFSVLSVVAVKVGPANKELLSLSPVLDRRVFGVRPTGYERCGVCAITALFARYSADEFRERSRYHLRHSGDWMLRLGDGTEESHQRVQNAVNELWRYSGELFMTDEMEQRLVSDGIAVDSAKLEALWRAQVDDVLHRAGLTTPGVMWMQRGGRFGRHTEHLGHMLAEMQILQRQHPGASW